jgi:hypothetical protein
MEDHIVDSDDQHQQRKQHGVTIHTTHHSDERDHGTVRKVDAVQNGNNSSGNSAFLTQMGDRIIQPLITVIKIYKTHSIGDFNYY